MTNQIADLGFQNSKDNSMMEVAASRAEHEVQASFVIAKKFPRSQHQSYVDIIEACKRPNLAEAAMYSYPKGKQVVFGASIRLAEAMAAAWGNLDCGVKELSQSDGVSVAEAYAIDLQTNYRVSKIFHVKHERHTKTGKKQLTDPRDIYEAVANNGARRLRACILAVIPSDVVEAAIEQCNKTMQSSDVPLSEQVNRMVKAFNEYGVKVSHIEKRLGHNLDAVIPSEIVTLKSIYKSLKDNMASREDFFEIQGASKGEVESGIKELIENKNKTIDKETGEILNDMSEKETQADSLANRIKK